MVESNKQLVRDEIEKDYSWVVIDGILGDSVSVLDWNKPVEIIYEDMDGRPQMCHADCVKEYNAPYFVATDGAAKGNRMVGVIAYRPMEKHDPEWVRPDDATTSSYKYKCPVCKKVCHQVTGNCGRKYKVSHPKCTYNFCPWCGVKMKGE